MTETITRVEFYDIYNKKLEPQLEELEVERKKEDTKAKRCYLILLLILPIGIFTFQNVGFMGFVISFIVLLVITFSIIKKIQETFRQKLKREVISKILQIYGNIYFSDNKDIISLKEIKNMGLFPDASQKLTDDVIIGEDKGWNFSISETILTHQETRGSGDSRSTETITDFSGIIVKIQMKKKFHGKTIVGWKGYVRKLKGFESVELESIDFMKYRNVYSTDQIEARYILTTSFMERLAELGKIFFSETTTITGNNEIATRMQMAAGAGSYSNQPIIKAPEFAQKMIIDSIEKATGVNAAFIDGYAYLFIPTSDDFFEAPAGYLLKPDEYYKIIIQLKTILNVIEFLNCIF